MKGYVFAALCFFLCPLLLTAQEYGYTHYDIKEGLAGSTVYAMVQDKEGFIWFATETGLSRFDGTHFKKFTKADGLPDNEIIQLFADSKGRVWISPFKKVACYYYKGKIYNPGNDSVLRHIHMHDNIVGYAEDAQGNILLQEPHSLHLVKSNGQVTFISTIGNDSTTFISAIGANVNGGFWVLKKNKIFQFNNDRFLLRKEIPSMLSFYNFVRIAHQMTAYLSSETTMSVLSMSTGKTVVFPYKYFIYHANAAILGEHTVACATTKGALIYDVNKPDSGELFLPGIPVSNMLEDTEGSWWFSTFGKGVYRLTSAYMRNIKIKQPDNQELAVNCFMRHNESVLVGANGLFIPRLSVETGLPEPVKPGAREAGNSPGFHYVYSVYTLSPFAKNKVLMGGSRLLIRLSPDLKWEKDIFNILVKGICTNKNKILVCTNNSAVEIDSARFVITDTILHERGTAIYANNDTVYIGTLNGLYRVLLPGKTQQNLGSKSPLLRNRIAAITEDLNHVVWVATYGEGIIAWKDGRVVKQISEKDGLTSNICRTVFLDKNDLWVGTDKGLNKINVSHPDYPIKKYTTGDGLATDIINAIYVSNGKVFVGTPEGVTFFDEQKVSSQSHCDLTFTDISIGGQTYYPTNMPSTIPHGQNILQFNYAGISYKSAGDIRYRYRLLGLDSNWKETRETFLSYPTLPSGDYQLQIYAINKFDVVSKMITAGFTIEKLMSETTWFKLLIGLAFLVITGSLVWLIIYRIRRREQEKTAINKRIGDLEQLARKAQMNPHFIFNSLNSIQQYVMDADITGANKFISGFSRLIRQTLDFSSRHDITLAQELDYLSNYLDLERTRLENAFGWSVSVAPDVNTAEYHIPPMILQPFVENSVRHGLRFRRDREGQVNIHIKKENNYLVCMLEDNGIGRKAALKLKSVNAIEYQSKGMSLTAERIAMLNKDNPNKITMQIEDLEDGQHNALGTRVTISFPDAGAGMQ